MKKKLLSVILALVLVFSLSATAMAVGPANKPALTAKTTQTGDTTEVNTLLITVMNNRASILSIKSQNVTLAAQLKTILMGLKSNGSTVPEETLTQLTALKDQLKGVHGQLADTRGQLDGLMATYKQYRQARDFENAAAVLQQVITIQQSRITLETQIGTLTQQMIDLVSAI